MSVGPALNASSNLRFGVEWTEWMDGDLAVSSADGSGGERMDCRDVIVPAAWVLSRPDHKL